MNKENCPEELKFSFTAKAAGLEDLKYAQTISEWTLESGTMLAKTPEEIIGFMQDGRSAIVVNAGGEVVSHVAASFIYRDGSVEVGALCTDKEFRGHGAAIMATNFLLGILNEKYPDKNLFALANPMSAKLFEKIGAERITCSELSDEVWENCSTCLNNPNKSDEVILFECCDTPYGFNNLVEDHR